MTATGLWQITQSSYRDPIETNRLQHYIQGLRVRAALDTRKYPTGIRVDDTDRASLSLTPDKFHGDWNYRLAPTGSNIAKKQADQLREKL